MELEGRMVVFRSLVGSHNYNLNNENSDEDYKYFTLPTFDDLYDGKFFSTSKISQFVDYDSHDIRKIPQLFYKSNLNFLEVLFSKDMRVYQYQSKEDFDELLEMREDIARMNLRGMYHACIGMYKQKMKSLYKGTESTKCLVEKYGYDTKMGSHAYRVLDFLKRYANSGFESFGNAIWYNDDEKDFIMSIKNGECELDKFLSAMENLLYIVEMRYKNKYILKDGDEHTNEQVKYLIKKIVKENLEYQ